MQRFALWLLKLSLLCLQHLLKLIVATLAGMLDFVAGIKYVSVFSTSCDFTFVPGAKNLSLFLPFRGIAESVAGAAFGPNVALQHYETIGEVAVEAELCVVFGCVCTTVFCECCREVL